MKIAQKETEEIVLNLFAMTVIVVKRTQSSTAPAHADQPIGSVRLYLQTTITDLLHVYLNSINRERYLGLYSLKEEW
jgi:hypothetical protein